MGLCFARFVFLTFRGPLASHGSNPHPKRSRISHDTMPLTLKNAIVAEMAVSDFFE